MPRKRRILAVGAIALCAIFAAHAFRRPATTATIFYASGRGVVSIECRRVLFGFDGRRCDAIVVTFANDAVTAKVVDLAARPSLEEAVTGSGALFGINGGYFDAAFRPVGLLRTDGRDIGAIARDQPPLSGILSVDGRGFVRLSASVAALAATDPAAVQCGPFLIDPGGRVGIRAAYGPTSERTVVATDGIRTAVIVTGPVSLYDLAACLHEHADAIGLAKIDCALNLDGGPSTGIILSAPNARLGRPPRTNVRDAVMFFERRQ